MKNLYDVKNKGYWQVDGRQFEIKINAMLYAQAVGKPVTFHYNDQWWDALDWTKEPATDIHDLYAQRAKELREKYDYVIIKYSGGADSTNIIRTFVDNGLKIDAIVTNEGYGLSNTPRELWPQSEEKIKIVDPFIANLKTQIDFEYYNIDYSNQMLLMDSPDWIFKLNVPRLKVVEILACRGTSNPVLEKYNHNRTCVVTGIDKPWIHRHHNKIWAFEIPDWVPVLCDNGHDNMIQEPFYFSADWPEIPCKQSHMVKNYFHQSENQSKLNDNTDYSFLRLKTTLVPLIYPRYCTWEPCTPLPYFDPKFDGYGPIDTNATHNIKNTPVYDNWKDGIDLANSLLDTENKYSENIWGEGPKWQFTKPRWLGK
jgi:hypothetical protein